MTSTESSSTTADRAPTAPAPGAEMYDIAAIVEHYNRLKADAEPLSQIGAFEELLDECVDLGAVVEARADREVLQVLANRVAFDVFQLTRHYPSAQLKPLAAPAKPGRGRQDARESELRLPEASRELFGRERELEMIDIAWKERKVNVMTVVAWGGTGKTSLVRRWYMQMKSDRFPGAECVFTWHFDADKTEDRFFRAALEFFGLSGDDLAGKGDLLARAIGERRCLLVLDGLELLQEPSGPRDGALNSPELRTLLRGLAEKNDGLCLITTRVPVRDLDRFAPSLAAQIDLDQLRPEAGAQLLASLGVVGPVDELMRASQEFEGHALAVTLLGRYLLVAHGGDVYCRDNVKLLDQQDSHGRQAMRVMRSYEEWFPKGAVEIAMLRLFGLFDGPVEWAHVEILMKPEPIAGLTELLAKTTKEERNLAVARLQELNLLTRSNPAGTGLEGGPALTFDAHPLVREYFGEQLRREQHGAWSEGHRRLFTYYERNPPPLRPETLDQMRPLYQAVAHGCKAGLYRKALRYYVEHIQRGEEYYGARKFSAFSYELSALSCFFDPPFEEIRNEKELRGQDRLRIQIAAAYALRARSRVRDAQALLDRALQYPKDFPQWSSAIRNLSDVSLLRGELRSALDFALRVLRRSKQRKNKAAQKLAMVYVAMVQALMGNRDKARESFEDAERLQPKIDGRDKLHQIEGFRYCEFLLDEAVGRLPVPLMSPPASDDNVVAAVAAVRDRAEEILDWDEPNDRKQDIALHHLTIGRALMLEALYSDAPQYESAQNELDEAVDELLETQHLLIPALIARAMLGRLSKQFERARSDLNEALTIAASGGMRRFLPDIHLESSRLHLVVGDRPLARAGLNMAKEAIGAMRSYRCADREVRQLERELEPGLAPASDPMA